MSEPISNEVELEEIAREAATSAAHDMACQELIVRVIPDLQYLKTKQVADLLVRFIQSALTRVTENAEKEKAELREFIEQYFVNGVLRFPDGRSYREHAKELLMDLGLKEAYKAGNLRDTESA